MQKRRLSLMAVLAAGASVAFLPGGAARGMIRSRWIMYSGIASR